jgi:hypothetical protein
MPAMSDRERHLRLQAALAVVVFYALGYTDRPDQESAGVDETAASLATVVAAVLAAPAASPDPPVGSRLPGR